MGSAVGIVLIPSLIGVGLIFHGGGTLEHVAGQGKPVHGFFDACRLKNR
jgi:hypothetical protein